MHGWKTGRIKKIGGTGINGLLGVTASEQLFGKFRETDVNGFPDIVIFVGE
jgi:hypothetical protein